MWGWSVDSDQGTEVDFSRNTAVVPQLRTCSVERIRGERNVCGSRIQIRATGKLVYFRPAFSQEMEFRSYLSCNLPVQHCFVNPNILGCSSSFQQFIIAKRKSLPFAGTIQQWVVNRKIGGSNCSILDTA